MILRVMSRAKYILAIDDYAWTCYKFHIVKSEQMGFFSTKLADAMDKRSVSARRLAAEVDCCYEHVRKLLRAEALPSPRLARELCRVFKWKQGDVRGLVLLDHLRKRHGEVFWRAQGKDPKVEPFYIIDPYLTDEQHSFLMETARRCVTANRRRHR